MTETAGGITGNEVLSDGDRDLLTSIRPIAVSAMGA